MIIKTQLIALYTLVRREVVRQFRIPSQVFLPSMMTTVLYFLIFGGVIGSRVGRIEGYDYNTFIAPGLVMMAVITNAYANVSNSLFSVRFQKSIEDLLISPMHWSLLLLGYTLGGIIRGILISALVLFVSSFFTTIHLSCLPLTFVVILLVSALFSLAGFINGMIARTFDEVAFVPTFILTPLLYLGGIFYSITMLPSFWQNITQLNPIYYMISALRYAMLGESNINFLQALSILTLILIALIGLTSFLIKRGVGLRD